MKLSQIKTKLKQVPLLFLLPVIGIIFIGQAFLQHNILQADPKNGSFIWIIELLGFLVIGVLVWYVFRYLTKSIKSFSYYMEDMASGNIERSGKFKADKNGIWARMADSLNRFSDHYREKIQHEVTETGKDQWVSVTKLPLYDPEGNLMGTFGISKDVTQFKKLEMELKKKKGNN